jgi:isocitrate dehydrogenase kinase/phosphatase
MRRMGDTRTALARVGTDAIALGFQRYLDERNRITRRARDRFVARAWAAAQADARDRLDLRDQVVLETVGGLRAELGALSRDRELWIRMKERFESEAATRPDGEVAATFFSSVTRRLFATVGVDPAIEFLASRPPREEPGAEPVYRTFPRRLTSAALLTDVLRAFDMGLPFVDLEAEVRLAAAELDHHLRTLDDGQPVDAAEVCRVVFYRGKGAYLVGRLRRGRFVTPLVLPLVHLDDGLHLDAALFTTEDASIVFSFTRAYFHVEVDRPRDLVAFLATLVPHKRASEIYTALGFHKHGKTELYREIERHLAETGEAFEPARGDKGLVMSVFTLPSLDLVFKIIKDRFPPPKQTSRREIMAKYRHVFRHDRAGRLVDATEFEHLAFPRARFSEAVLKELGDLCGETVRPEADRLHLSHLYVERRVTPLNLLVREADEWTARQAVLDFGQSLKDLAATNTFPGDMLLKNFGVTRHGRVIFYDYDELAPMTECSFRDLPTARHDDEETSGEAWFFVGDNDIFPAEFLPFLGLQGRLRHLFTSAHGDLLTARYWRDAQERIRAGEIVDIYPYREEQRLRHAR